MKRKTKKVIGIVGLILIGIIIFWAFGVIKFPLFSVSSSTPEYIQTPVFGYYECSGVTYVIPSNHVIINNQETYDTMKCPINSESCTFSVLGESTSILARRLCYRICPSFNVGDCYKEKCEPVDTNWFDDSGRSGIDIPGNYNSNNQVLVKYEKCVGVYTSYTGCVGSWEPSEGAEWWATYVPYILWFTSPGTGRHEYTTLEQGCTFPDSGKLINSINDVKGFTLTQTSSSSTTLEPHKTRNVIEGYLPKLEEDIQFVTWNGKQGYCLNRVIYSIATITTQGGKTLKVVDVNWNNQLADLIANGKQCCPQDKEITRKCGSDFMWHPIEEAECDYMNSCSGDWYPSTIPRQLIRYDCDYTTGKCSKKLTRNVECTTNADCIGNSKGGVCDTLLWECSSISPPITNGSCPTSCKNDSDCFNCGEGYTCQNKDWFGFGKGTCKKAESPNGKKYCETCFDWASNFFKSDADKCDSQPVVKPTFSWNPFTWITGGAVWTINQTGITNQSLLCPFYILMIILIGFIVIFIIIILVGVGFKIKRWSKK